MREFWKTIWKLYMCNRIWVNYFLLIQLCWTWPFETGFVKWSYQLTSQNSYSWISLRPHHVIVSDCSPYAPHRCTFLSWIFMPTNMLNPAHVILTSVHHLVTFGFPTNLTYFPSPFFPFMLDIVNGSLSHQIH